MPAPVPTDSVPVAILGASGYTGAELIRLLLGHPHARVAALYAQRAAGSRLTDVYPQFAGRFELDIDELDPDHVAERATIAFAALPHGASARAIAALRERDVTVIDLSADFRLRDVQAYREWYGDHPATSLLGEAVYGLPERYRDQLRGARLIASPGCYPTSAILAIAPLIEAGLVFPDGLIIDAKSGASGAGRSPAQATHLPEAAEGIRAYKIGGAHRHTPEIEQEIAAIAGRPVTLTFTPHLCPMSRGIFTCVYGAPTDPARAPADYRAVLERVYGDEPFVSLLPEGRIPDTSHVRGSNRAHVNVAVDTRAGRVIAMAAIDNLVKGAAGQAIQAMNIAMAWDETAGLDTVGIFP